MDPNGASVRRDGLWFPRPRGDGPWDESTENAGPSVSPPTRGWTQVLGPERPPRAGFPAHAGMDPSSVSLIFASRWFPRPRGDGPPPTLSDTRRTTVSPPTRGWTPDYDMGGRSGNGFPAHAGMDPTSAPTMLREAWFPRPRGDGPVSWLEDGFRSSVSPPTRGWTLLEGMHADHRIGFPAHAGMDPPLQPRSWQW